MERRNITPKEAPRVWTIPLERSAEVSRNTDINAERRESALRYIERESRTRYSVILEGPPIYLWPAMQSQTWDTPAFRSGWSLVNDATKRLPQQKLQEYILIDDFNYRPKLATEVDEQKRMNALWQSSDDVNRSSITIDPPWSVRRISEKALAEASGERTCSRLDAEFNRIKIIDQLKGFGENGWLYPENLNKLLLVVVNPDSTEIRSEQLNMIQALYEKLRQHDAFQRVSKRATREILCEMYRHIWVNKDGHIGNVTGFTWDQNKFNLSSVSV
jgi:hypothetical protein